MIEKANWSDRIYTFISYLTVAGFAIICLLPFYIMVVSSFTDDLTLRLEGYSMWHSKWTTKAYEFVLRGSEVRRAYLISILRTLVGTAGSVITMAGTAYVLSSKRLKGRIALAFYVYFSRVFTPTLIPWFVWVRNGLSLHDNMGAIILPMMVQAYWIMVMRNFFSSLPGEILESAYVDGASDLEARRSEWRRR